jgi:hypothetical protein
LLVNAPSLNTGSENRFVVAIGTTRPVSFSAFLNSFLIRAASDSPASIGIRSLSWKFTPYAPHSASSSTICTGESGSRTGEPNGSRPVLPTVHRPNVNFIFGSGA